MGFYPQGAQIKRLSPPGRNPETFFFILFDPPKLAPFGTQRPRDPLGPKGPGTLWDPKAPGPFGTQRPQDPLEPKGPGALWDQKAPGPFGTQRPRAPLGPKGPRTLWDPKAPGSETLEFTKEIASTRVQFLIQQFLI